MNFTTITFCIGLFLYAGYLYVKWTYNYWKRSKIQYIEPKFPFGNLQVVEKLEHTSLQLATIYKKYKNGHYASLLGIFFYLRPVLLVFDLDLVRQIFISDFQYFQHR